MSSEDIKYNREGLTGAAASQALPVTNTDSVDVLDDLIGGRDYLGQPLLSERVAQELKERRELGIRKYGIGLQTNNGRDVLFDIRQELLDTVMYGHQGVMQGQRVAHIRNAAIKLLRELEALEKAT